MHSKADIGVVMGFLSMEKISISSPGSSIKSSKASSPGSDVGTNGVISEEIEFKEVNPVLDRGVGGSGLQNSKLVDDTDEPT